MAPTTNTRSYYSTSVSSSASSSDRYSAPPTKRWVVERDPTEMTSASMVSSATRSTRSTSTTRRSSSGKRTMMLSDRQLADIAADTEAAVQWSSILTRDPTGSASDRTQWKRIDDAGGFAVYTKQEQYKFAVLAVGLVPCSVPEVARLLHAPDAEKYLVNMEGLYGEDFKDGAFLHRVSMRRLAQDDLAVRNDDLLGLSVKSAVFSKSGWRHHHPRWSFLEAAYRRDGGKSFEKLTTTLSPKDVVVPKSRMSSASTFPSFSRSSSDISFSAGGSSKDYFHDVTTAFSVQPEEQYDHLKGDDGSESSHTGRETRVYFYGEFAPPNRHGFSMPSLTRSSSTSSGKGIKQRLVAMARSCDRLTALVRRRRLGVQVLVDRRILAFTASSKKCVCCSKSIMMLAIKQCRICGQGVCTECSHKHERETKSLGSQRMMLEDIRVCDHCLDRVDRSDFSELNDVSLLGPVVLPNPPNAPAASTVLKDLLKDELFQANSDKRKASVMNVIKCVLDQEDACSSALPSPALSTASATSSRHGKGAVLLTSTKGMFHEADFVDALETLRVKQVPFSEAELSTATGRSYVVDASNPDQQMTYPVPDNEAERLKAMEEAKVKELINNSDELNIICELASKEMDTFASMVTIVTPDEQQVVASNLDGLQNATFPRAEAFCSHTIMDDRPILIPHPEADVRFHQCGPVKELGIRYYCGFPIKNQDNTVIGALCCINKESRDMTETQFNAMQKLAKTASKVIQVQGKQARPRTTSTLSSESK